MKSLSPLIGLGLGTFLFFQLHGFSAIVNAATGTGGYVNPFGAGWQPARTDQGVDYQPAAPEPVRAIGRGVVIYSTTSSGWPGGAWLAYRLASGRAKGNVVYIAEHLTGLLPAGAKVKAGDTLATAWPGYPWLETGWANCAGTDPVIQYNGAPDGTPMPGGKAFARFLRHLGASTQQDPGPGPDIIRSC